MATATKTIDAKIINCLSALNLEEKKAVLTVVETFAKEGKQAKDFWSEFSKEQKELVDKAIKEADSGKMKSHKQVMSKLRK